MAGEREGKSESQGLEITLGSRELPVSNLSSMLRVLQAALREIARAEESTRERFSRNPQPTLHLSARTEAGDLILSLSFLDSLDTDPQEDLSSATFQAFLARLGDFIKSAPQRDLWGDAVGGPNGRDVQTDIDRRLDQVRRELRRLPRARLSFGTETIGFEGGRVEFNR